MKFDKRQAKKKFFLYSNRRSPSAQIRACFYWPGRGVKFADGNGQKPYDPLMVQMFPRWNFPKEGLPLG